VTTYRISAPDGNTYQIDGPEGATDDDIRAQVLKQHPGASRAAEDQSSRTAARTSKDGGVPAALEPILAMLSGMVAKPASDAAGLAALPLHAAGLIDKDPQTLKEDIQRGMTYEPKTRAGQVMTEYNPLALLAKGVDWVGGKAESAYLNSSDAPAGSFEEAVGHGIHETVNQLPAMLGVKAPAAVRSMGGSLQDTSRGLMQSALKPDMAARRTGKAAAGVETLLQEGVNVSKGGVEHLRSRIDALDNEITSIITNSNATVSKGAVASRLQDTMARFEKQVNASKDVATIQSAWDEFLMHPLLAGKADIPVKLAQEMKQGTYRAIGDKPYGELSGAAIESQKTLARGLKEEIANAVPAVRALNAEESQLLNALNLTERRVLQAANNNPVGLGLLASRPIQIALWMADRSNTFKSLVARMLYKTGDSMQGAGNIAGPLVGLGVTDVAENPAVRSLPPPQPSMSLRALSQLPQ
jgi:hypothetical protein